MKIIIKKLSIITVLITLCCNFLDAKTFRILALSDDIGYKELETYDYENSKIIKIPISERYASPTFKVPPNGVVTLYEKFPLEGEISDPILKLNFLGQSNETLILLNKDPKDESKIKHKFIDSSKKVLPGGSLLVINSCKNTIMAKFGEQVERFPAKNTRLVNLIDTKAEDVKPFSGLVKFAGPLNGQLDFFVSTMWYIPSSLRQIIILSENQERGKYELRKVNLH